MHPQSHFYHLHHYWRCLAGKVAFSPNLPALEAAEILDICNFQRLHFSLRTITLAETPTWQVVEGGGKLSRGGQLLKGSAHLDVVVDIICVEFLVY